MLELLFVPFHLGFFAGGFKAINEVLIDSEILVEVIEITILCLDFIAVLQAIVCSEAVQGTFADKVGVEFAAVSRVDGDENVGHNAATTVDGTTAIGLIFQ